MEGKIVEMMDEGGSGWAADGQRRGSGGAVGQLARGCASSHLSLMNK